MPVYPLSKYGEQVEALKRQWHQFGYANILKIQTRARKISAAVPPFAQKVQIPSPPESDLVDSLLCAVDGLGQGSEQYQRPPIINVSAEWVFSDANSRNSASNNGPVIFYIHGGGFIYGSPGTARRTTQQLARRSQGRCFAVQYRYATEQPFPAQLLDLFVAYLSLLAPPPGMEDILTPANKIVFAGESAGLNLLLSLLQVLLYLRRERPTVRFHGRDINICLPAGVAGLSGMLDITYGLPSWHQNTQWDCMQECEPTYTPGWEDQELWPTDPPRADVYCEKSAMTHPLVSPVTAATWKGSPPLFLACGEERYADSNLYVARRAAQQGVPVYLQQYEHMLHVWPTVLPKLPHSNHILDVWAVQCRRMSEGVPFETLMEVIAFDTLQAITKNVNECTPLTRSTVLTLLERGKQARQIISRANPKTRL